MFVLQPWLADISMMQQTVLLTAIRGPDGLPKYGGTKMLLRWYRRCVLLSAMDGRVLTDPIEQNGGSFTGPSLTPEKLLPYEDWRDPMDTVVGDYLKEVDAIPHHFQMHLLHAIEILGYKHPDIKVRTWWNGVYERIVSTLHLHPETEEEMDLRLGDNRVNWLKRSDPATTE